MTNSNFMGKDGFHWFVGVVESRNDPSQIGRVQVRVLGHHTDNKNSIPTEDLPWATVMMPTTSSANSGIGTSPSFIVEGSWVVGFFMDIFLYVQVYVRIRTCVPIYVDMDRSRHRFKHK